MKKIAIIGANSFQNPLILKAKEMGYETHVFAWECGDVGEKTADYFYPVSIIEKEEILEICRKVNIDAIVSIASDLATATVNYVAENLDLPGNSMDCTMRSTNKYQMRLAFRENHIPTPQFIVASEEMLEGKSSEELTVWIDGVISQIKLPVIVKPTDRSGSRCVNKIQKKEELEPAIRQAVASSFEKKAIIEEYLEGKEFSLEGISFQGKHHFLCVTRKSTTGAPHFIETGHIQPAGLSKEMEENIHQVMERALDALGITNSATHCEFKITPSGQVRIIEIGARMGGDCIGSDLVHISTGYDFVKMVIETALGQEPSFGKVRKPGIAVIRFIMNEQNVEELERFKKEAPELLYYISSLEPVNSHEVLDSSTRYGYYILACENKEKIRWLLNEREQY